VVLQDTVEKDVAGMAEKIITEDEQKRSQELVHVQSDKVLRCISIECFVFRMFSTLRQNDQIGI
jgi:hypothetical protein